jgi:hypothetical protein
MDSQIQELVQEISARWGTAVTGIESITPDASLRRYFRLGLGKRRPIIESSAILMVFDSLQSPESGGAYSSVGADQAYLELTQFLAAAGVPVPKVYLDCRDLRCLLIEDLGDTQLADVIIGVDSASYTADQVLEFYREAIDGILGLQAIPLDSQRFFYQRRFDKSAFVSEMMEFWDFVLVPEHGETLRREVIIAAFARLAADLEQTPYSLVHRDYHSWNLLVDLNGAVRVIDFQDALLGPRSYDIVGLLNDRDTDAALGDELYTRLFGYFAALIGDEAIYREYDLALLQRDLKVAGRFAKLAETRGLLSYRLWIPGTLRRIGRTLGRMVAQADAAEQYNRLFEELCRLLPDVQTGANSPLRLV